ncbi:hypothetical protein B0I35DRAFT_407191 [Stachybotrys elegans]|uniref:Mid2 domain-containing protein n=1 Tax=Stachybotrys elegans TaxID=80388 RepID=A0A8K0STS3_9HYPO|nr:hypothetical protein B0I35DRAFT_407191 [Stachybotrys elegans]
MRSQLVLLFAAAAGIAHGHLEKRQAPPPPPSSEESTTAPAEETTTTAPPTEPTTTTTTTSEEDTTTTRTITVTGNVDTVTSTTTILRTITSTVTNTETTFVTETVTGGDADVATRTVYETTTQWIQRRGLEYLAPLTAAPARTVPAEAPAETLTHDVLGLRDNNLFKRATITVTQTVTDGGGDAETVLVTLTRNVVRTVETEVTTTGTRTETSVNAPTTTTTTSTVTVTSTSVNTSDLTTETGGASQTNPPDNEEEGGGLSTGAQAGIGAGVGVAGLILIGAAVWYFLRRRRSPKPDHDDLMGASEVPVGGPGRGHGPSGSTSMAGMSEHATAAAFLAPGRSGTTKPNYSAEGYRGTAMGDGRAGYAKPAPYGAAYASAGSHPSTSPTTAYSYQTTRTGSMMADQLPQHPSPSPPPPGSAELGHDGGVSAQWSDPNATEIDGRNVTHQHTGPVYEMPSQHYR